MNNERWELVEEGDDDDDDNADEVESCLIIFTVDLLLWIIY